MTSYTPTVKASAVNKSADYTITDTDGYETILVTTGSSTITITMPSAANNLSRKIIVKKIDSGTGSVTVTRAGSDVLNGSNSKVVWGQYASIELMSDGSTNWFTTSEDWGKYSRLTAFTPTGTWTTNTTYTGFLRRSGDTLIVDVQVALAGAPNAASLRIDIPLALTIDTGRVVSSNGDEGTLGRVNILDGGTNYYHGFVNYGSTTQVRILLMKADTTFVSGTISLDNNNPIVFGNTDRVWIHFEVPVSQWS